MVSRSQSKSRLKQLGSSQQQLHRPLHSQAATLPRQRPAHIALTRASDRGRRPANRNVGGTMRTAVYLSFSSWSRPAVDNAVASVCSSATLA